MNYVKYQSHPKEQIERNKFIKELYATGKFSYKAIAEIVKTKFKLEHFTKQRVEQICNKVP